MSPAFISAGNSACGWKMTCALRRTGRSCLRRKARIWRNRFRGNTQLLAPHMTFSDEPGIYIRGEFGVRLEDDMRITENGAELFTPQSPDLEKPFPGQHAVACPPYDLQR